MVLAGLTPDRWQAATLRAATGPSSATGSAGTILLCSRQSGKSTVAAALAVREVLLKPGALVLMLSPTLRQSGELYRKAVRLYHALGQPVPPHRQTALTMELANGARIVSLPQNEDTVRGYSDVTLLIVDEASRVAEGLFAAVRPMLAVSRGRMLLASTPNGKVGFFYDAWEGRGRWRRVKVTADQCPRISPAFLAEERATLGPWFYEQEYLCEFHDAEGQLFPQQMIDLMFTPT
jgi:hypothetical protein